jgi:hypothetical protein
MAPDHPHLPPSMHSEMNAGKPWLRSDLLFLTDSLERGMSLVEVARRTRSVRRRESWRYVFRAVRERVDPIG